MWRIKDYFMIWLLSWFDFLKALVWSPWWNFKLVTLTIKLSLVEWCVAFLLKIRSLAFLVEKNISSTQRACNQYILFANTVYLKRSVLNFHHYVSRSGTIPEAHERAILQSSKSVLSSEKQIWCDKENMMIYSRVIAVII